MNYADLSSKQLCTALSAVTGHPVNKIATRQAAVKRLVREAGSRGWTQAEVLSAVGISVDDPDVVQVEPVAAEDESQDGPGEDQDLGQAAPRSLGNFEIDPREFGSTGERFAAEVEDRAVRASRDMDEKVLSCLNEAGQMKHLMDRVSAMTGAAKDRKLKGKIRASLNKLMREGKVRGRLQNKASTGRWFEQVA